MIQHPEKLRTAPATVENVLAGGRVDVAPIRPGEGDNSPSLRGQQYFQVQPDQGRALYSPITILAIQF